MYVWAYLGRRAAVPSNKGGGGMMMTMTGSGAQSILRAQGLASAVP